MARRPRITEASVAKLGVDRLATLLVTEASTNKALKQALQLALESGEGVDSLASGIRQRLTSIGRAQSRLSTNKGREMVAELKRLQASITGDVADGDPAEALALMWLLVDLHPSLIARTRDRAGRLGDFFREAVAALPDLAGRANPDPEKLAEDVYRRFVRDSYGFCEPLIVLLAAALRAPGLALLKSRFEAERDAHLGKVRRVQSAAAYDHVLARLQHGLRDVADAMGDVDGYIATFSPEETRHPVYATYMAVRLADADRADEALTLLDHAAPEFDDTPEWHMDWINARYHALQKLGRTEELKKLTWKTFETYLSHDHLRAHLKLLPDFDDVEAEEKALNWVTRHPAFLAALLFLVHWPALPRAAQTVSDRTSEIDGSEYDHLLEAAEALDGRFPLAGILIRRSLITFTLRLGRSHRFKQAMQHVRELEALDAAVTDYADHDTHQVFMEQLWLDHPHKAGFWSLLE
ncbi:MAG: DUF6880 family protein [Hyphomicrobiaceae bacterium]